MNPAPVPIRSVGGDRVHSRLLPELVLVGITILWGGTFLVTKTGLRDGGPLFFLALRFATAALVLAMVTPGLRRGWSLRDVRGPGLIGLAMVAGYALQTIGLRTLPSSLSAFITALYVPAVPLIQLLVLRRNPAPMVWVGIGMALAGLILLAGPTRIAGLTLGTGEWLSLGSALAFAMQIVLIGRFATDADSRRAAFVQLATVAIGSLLLMPVAGEALPLLTPTLLACAIGLGVVSAVIQVAMNWGQRHVSPARATLIYAAEPVYAGLIGWVAGDRLGMAALIGGALIVASVVVSELRPGERA